MPKLIMNHYLSLIINYIMKTRVSKKTGRATAKRRAAYPGLAWAGILGKTSGQRSVTLQRA